MKENNVRKCIIIWMLLILAKVTKIVSIRGIITIKSGKMYIKIYGPNK